MEPLLGRVAEACGRLFDAESAAFRLLEGEDLKLCGTWGKTADVMPAPPLKVGESLTGAVAATGEPLIVDNPSDDLRLNPVNRERYRQAGIRSFLGVPVKVDERVAGVLSIRITREGSFSAGDVEIARAFAAQAAIALENSRLYQETQDAPTASSRRPRISSAVAEDGGGRAARGRRRARLQQPAHRRSAARADSCSHRLAPGRPAAPRDVEQIRDAGRARGRA